MLEALPDHHSVEGTGDQHVSVAPVRDKYRQLLQVTENCPGSVMVMTPPQAH